MGNYIDLPNDDPKCPRIHLSLRLGGDRISRGEARNRLTAQQRERLADRIPFRNSLTAKDQDDLLDQIAGFLVRLDKVRLRKKAPKGAAERIRIPTAAAMEKDVTHETLRSVKNLRRRLSRASGRVRKRIQLELADPDAGSRRSEGELEYLRHLAGLEALEAALHRASARIPVKQGSDIGRAASSTTEQLASLWFKATGMEATAETRKTAGRFEPFVDVFFHNVPGYDFHTARMIKRVVEERATAKRYQHTDRDSESDN